MNNARTGKAQSKRALRTIYIETMVRLDRHQDMKPDHADHVIDLRDQERATGEGMPESKFKPQTPR